MTVRRNNKMQARNIHSNLFWQSDSANNCLGRFGSSDCPSTKNVNISTTRRAFTACQHDVSSSKWSKGKPYHNVTPKVVCARQIPPCPPCLPLRGGSLTPLCRLSLIRLNSSLVQHKLKQCFAQGWLKAWCSYLWNQNAHTKDISDTHTQISDSTNSCHEAIAYSMGEQFQNELYSIMVLATLEKEQYVVYPTAMRGLDELSHTNILAHTIIGLLKCSYAFAGNTMNLHEVIRFVGSKPGFNISSRRKANLKCGAKLQCLE